MANFKILTGKNLVNALNGHAAKVASYKERDHQLAASALSHLDQHNDACHLNTLFSVTPVNYRKALVAWSVKFGKCKFDAKALKFEYAKGKKSDVAAAMEIAPADYAKEAKPGKESTVKSAIDLLESLVNKADESAIECDAQLLSDLEAALNRAKARKVKADKDAKEAAIQRQVTGDKKEKQEARKAAKGHKQPIPGTVVLRVASDNAETVKEAA